ncbi:MAG: hypothetical protein A2117_02115 [Candidatus Wildermuthbacteria bacterium GWA2_46_15]|uniref:Transposase IS200-like domain-containing protein n=1 Tax=Candidatus Wildermuthbacteria bacterium GWA2_46_15 TaxID=1802443 RepID=A0A1G2QNE6_9BACT|nr:MAG: hypothetical protein A2117_02115 [Candidatus Wildermuthbacteria bacterium GWA2_46_15]
MANRNIYFEKRGIYHILTRAVDKKKFFADEKDCLRFVFQMFAANLGMTVSNFLRQNVSNIGRNLLVGREDSFGQTKPSRVSLVHILSFVLVVDHYHLLLALNEDDDGIPRYMQRLNTGFAMYFNLKKNRRGALFESRYKVVSIENERQLNTIIRYINITNPLDVCQPGWRERGVEDRVAAWNFLNKYQFSSFPDIFGKRNSSILASRSVLDEYLGESIIKDRAGLKELAQDYLWQKSNQLFINTLE